MRHNRQRKVNFLAGKQNMKQCKPKTFLACVTRRVFIVVFRCVSSQYHIFMPASGGQARISSNTGNSFFSVINFFLKVLNMKTIIAKLK